MKKIVIALTLILGLGITGMFAQKYTADVKNTELTWLGEKVTGEHTGSINLKSGNFTMTGDKLTSGVFEIDMSSITNADVEDADYNAKLVGHLKSDDFFGVAKYPTARFEITGSESFKNGNGIVKGNLTIKATTHPIEFRATMQQFDDGTRFFANITIDRSKYDIRYGSGSFFDNLGDKTIYDEFKLKINLLAKK
ncbi:MAG: YceI family protein [Bacteroidales bacterium]|nr:YceI family protein [Bacteroidales bacterium]MCF8457889.1 YceI family protein [Bacteroidales bacterium]